MPIDEDACAICDGDRSTNKNPIMFCDGNDCNVPVHKVCYGVDEIPDGEWYCQRCEARRNNKPARIVCCLQEKGAFKTTMKPGNFIHIVCAKFNPAINHDCEPYNVNRLRLDEQQCYKCEKTQGYCTRCQEDGCERWFHLTCGINAGLIPVSKKVPDTFSPRCHEHQPQDTIKKRLVRRYGNTTSPNASAPRGTRKRRLMQREVTESSPEEDNDESDAQGGESDEGEEEDDDEEEEEEDEEEEEEEEEEEQDDSDDDMGTKDKKKQKGPFKKRRATAPHTKKGGPIRLFMSDQSDSDDQMGSSNSGSSVTKPRGMLDLIEAKRKKSQLEKQKMSLQSTTAPLNTNLPSTPSSSSSSSHHSPVVPATAAPVTPPLQLQNKPSAPPPHRQKLPNKAHLMPNQSNNGVPKKPPVFRDLDDLQNDIVAQRRSVSTPSASSIPSSPYDAPVNGERRNTLPNQKPALYQQGLPPQPRRSVEPPQNDMNDIQKALIKSKINEIMEEVLAQPSPAKQNNGDESLRQELQRVREENRRLVSFKRNVAEVFEGLNVKVPSGLPVSVDKIEDYVSELRSMFVRSGAVREQDHARITQYVEDMIVERL